MGAATGDGGGVAAIIAAAGGGIAGVLGAIALLVRRRGPDEEHDSDDMENRPARLRERLTALETRAHGIDNRLDHHDEEIALLRAQEITAEGLTPRPRRRRPPQ